MYADSAKPKAAATTGCIAILCLTLCACLSDCAVIPEFSSPCVRFPKACIQEEIVDRIDEVTPFLKVATPDLQYVSYLFKPRTFPFDQMCIPCEAHTSVCYLPFEKWKNGCDVFCYNRPII